MVHIVKIDEIVEMVSNVLIADVFEIRGILEIVMIFSIVDIVNRGMFSVDNFFVKSDLGSKPLSM